VGSEFHSLLSARWLILEQLPKVLAIAVHKVKLFALFPYGTQVE
jgi:hypothetical protein